MFNFSGDTGSNCTVRMIPQEQTMPHAWNWLEEAHYMVYHEPGQNITRDSWVEHVRALNQGVYIYSGTIL